MAQALREPESNPSLFQRLCNRHELQLVLMTSAEVAALTHAQMQVRQPMSCSCVRCLPRCASSFLVRSSHAPHPRCTSPQQAWGTGGLRPHELRAVLHALQCNPPSGRPAQQFIGLIKEKVAALPPPEDDDESADDLATTMSPPFGSLTAHVSEFRL